MNPIKIKTRYSQLVEPIVRELRNRRIDADLSQDVIASRIFVTRSVLSRMENLVVMPNPDTLVLWAEALGFRVELLLRKEI